MKYSIGFPLVLLALQLQFSTSFVGAGSATVAHTSPLAPNTLAYQYRLAATTLPLNAVMPTLAPTASDSSNHSEATLPAAPKTSPTTQSGFSTFLHEAANELTQAWYSIRALFR